MKILLLNGSPRRAKANSRIVLDEMRKRLGENHEYRMTESMITAMASPADLDVDLIIVAFPLYIDCLHSRLLNWLMSAEKLLADEKKKTAAERPAMIAIANNGFHEGVQNRAALDILVNFCARTGITWRGGAGIGSGEMMMHLREAPETMFIKRPVTRVLDDMAALAASAASSPEETSLAGSLPQHRYVTHNLLWKLYQLAAHAGWRKQGRENGLKPDALFARPLEER